MHVETHADALRVRGVLRDLVALSAVPAAWIGREPPAVATGLADTLMALLQLSFVFVRLSDPGGAGAVEVTRGSAWKGFPEWLEGHLATSGQFQRKEIIPEAASPPSRSAVLPSPSASMASGAWSLPRANAAIFPLR